jgi:hypothetical protein
MLVDEAAAAMAAEDPEHLNQTQQEGAGSRYSFLLRYLVALVLSGRTSKQKECYKTERKIHVVVAFGPYPHRWGDCKKGR